MQKKKKKKKKKTDKTLEELIITAHEIKDVLHISNVNKASGPDLISYKCLKLYHLKCQNL